MLEFLESNLIDLALLPAAVFFVYMYRKDNVEKEPVGLLLLLIFGGVLSCGFAYVGETALEYIYASIFTYGTILWAFCESFLEAALVEEIGKYIFLKLFSWKNKNFNCTFDGIIYAVMVSLGFAAGENILYVTSYGVENALMRAVTSIPGHVAFSVLMGIYYSKAKLAEVQGNKQQSQKYRFLSLFVAILAHGLYDFCLFVQIEILYYVWFGVLLAMYLIIFISVGKASKEDTVL